MPLELEIVTPEARVYQETVESVVLPTTTGEIGILPGHIPIVSEIAAGEIVAKGEGEPKSLAVSHGFAQCVGDKVSVIAEDAIDIEDIDIAAVEEAQRRAEESLKNVEDMTPEQIEMLETQVRYARAQVLVRRKR